MTSQRALFRDGPTALRVSAPWRCLWQMKGRSFIWRFFTLKHFVRAAASDLKSINTRYSLKNTFPEDVKMQPHMCHAFAVWTLCIITCRKHDAINDGFQQGLKIHPWYLCLGEWMLQRDAALLVLDGLYPGPSVVHYLIFKPSQQTSLTRLND